MKTSAHLLITIIVAVTFHGAAGAQLKVKATNTPPSPWVKPTVQVEGGRIAFNSLVKLAAAGQRTMHANVLGRVVSGSKDRVYLCAGRRRCFRLNTSDVQSGGVKVDLAPVKLGNLPRAPIGGLALAKHLASQSGGHVRAASTCDYPAMKRAIEAGKTVVVDVYANTDATYNKKKSEWAQLWNPTTNKARPVLQPIVSEYSHRHAGRRGMVVTHVTDTHNPYTSDRYLHRLFDPQSGLFTDAGSSTFKYPNTIMNAWVVGK